MANPKSKSRKKKIIIFSVIVLALAGLGTVAVLKKREPVITVQTEKVGRRNLTELVVANGRIQPVLQVKISPEVSGEIIELPVKEGQRVKKGDLLLKIKPDLYVAAVNSMEASFKSSLARQLTSEANLRKMEAEHKRFEQLHKEQLVSDSTFLEAKTGYEVARAEAESAKHQIEMARASLVRAQEDLSKTTINSPLDGTVSRLNSQLGERVVGTAMMAGTEIMVIADLNEMEARVDIGEIDVVLIALGQVARLEVDAFKDRKFGGTVTEIANASKGSGMGMGGGQSQDATKFEVKIRIKEKEPFRPGMTVTAEVETRSRTNVLTVPIASVTTRLPKPPSSDKTPGKGEKKTGGSTTTNAPATGASATATAQAGTPPSTNKASTSGTNAVVATAGTNAPSAGGTNATGQASAKKPSEAPKPIEVVFVKEGEKVKMVPVKRGIGDDAYMEITEGVQEGTEVVSGGYKAISRELEDGKKVVVGPAKGELPKDKK